MRAGRFGAISSLENRLPDALYIAFVDSLLVEIKALILSMAAVTASDEFGLITRMRPGDPLVCVLGTCTTAPR